MKIVEVEDGYDKFAKTYKETHAHLDSFDWERARELCWNLLDTLKGKQDPHILEVGCGDARILARVQKRCLATNVNAQLHGWDISERMLVQAGKKLGKNVILTQVDLENPFSQDLAPSGGFSLVLMFFVLVHIANPQALFEDLRKVMAPGGILLANSIRQKEGYTVHVDGSDYQIRFWDHSPEEIENALCDAGYEIVTRFDGPWSTLFYAKIP